MSNKWIAVLAIVIVLVNLMVVEAHDEHKGKGKKSHDDHEGSKGHHGKGEGSKEHHGKGKGSKYHHGPHNMTCGWTDGDQKYDFSWLSHRTFSFKDDANEVYFSFCRTVGRSDNRTTIPNDCDSDANVCLKVDGEYINGGKSDTKWSTIENGVAMSFENGETCESETRSTTVEITCNPELRRFTIKSVESSGCHTTVKAESRLACKRSEEDGVHGDGNRHGSDDEDGENNRHHGKHGKSRCHKRKIIVIASSVGAAVFGICLIAAIAKCIKRRRQRSAIRRFEEEQVGFLQHVQQPMVPSYEPFNPDASMNAFPHIEMYPVQVVTQGNQVDADAELARRLQEQFNRGL